MSILQKKCLITVPKKKLFAKDFDRESTPRFYSFNYIGESIATKILQIDATSAKLEQFPVSLANRAPNARSEVQNNKIGGLF